MGATAAALVDLSTVAGNKISNPPWVKFQSAGWVNFPSAPTLRDGFAKRQLLMNRAVTGCKLSRRTTRDIAESPAVRGEVEKLVRDCRAAGKRVVLEGIEDAAELEIARALEIEFCQGFYFGRPALPEYLFG
ncbi:EAL domain-containing protein [Pseudomonas aeruginosa]|uniref:EAL domain-containing protein n=1 Tax=Pseudomonas aeruginosa TaxID=287 RepID=UPI00320F2F31